MLKELEWPSLESRRDHIRLAMLYRIRLNLVDIDWKNHLKEHTSSTRGHGSRFWTPFCSNQNYAASFFPRTSKEWNALKMDPINFPSLDAFKGALREAN